jgi:hypothetical protein
MVRTGTTVAAVARELAGPHPTRGDVELARRCLDRLERRGSVVAVRFPRGGPGGTQAVRYALA